ncbi:hypothetical protein KSF78_0009743, partial [Schistosoma japonicum]
IDLRDTHYPVRYSVENFSDIPNEKGNECDVSILDNNCNSNGPSSVISGKENNFESLPPIKNINNNSSYENIKFCNTNAGLDSIHISDADNTTSDDHVYTDDKSSNEVKGCMNSHSVIKESIEFYCYYLLRSRTFNKPSSHHFTASTRDEGGWNCSPKQFGHGVKSTNQLNSLCLP